MELFNGQLHQQQPGGHPNALVTPLCDSPRVDLPSISQNSVNPSPPTTTNHIYPHPYSKYRVYSSSEDDDLPPRPKVPRTHVYPHPQANSRAYSSSEDDDLPPRPRGSRNKASSKPPQVGLDRSPSPPRETRHIVLRDWDFADFHKFLWENELDANRNIQLFVVPNDMYWPWPDEAQAHRQLFNAETNDIWNKDKSPLAMPREPKMAVKDTKEVPTDELADGKSQGLEDVSSDELADGKPQDVTEVPSDELADGKPQVLEDVSSDKLAYGNPRDVKEVTGDELADDKPRVVDPRGLFSVYTYRLITRQLTQAQIVFEKSTEASLVNKNYEKLRDVQKMWPMGVDFKIFCRSERLGLQNTPIVPFNLHGTITAARSFVASETMMRKLGLLELCSVFELPPVSTSADLAKIAYAFYKGEEVPENVDSLPNSPDAIPREFVIHEDGRSDRAKVIAEKPLADERLQIFLQDVLISNHLEQVLTENKTTMTGNMRVHRNSSYADVKEKLKARERNVGKTDVQQTLEDREKRQRLRRKAWWSNYHAIIARLDQEFAKADKAIDEAEFAIHEVTGLILDGMAEESQDAADGESATEVGEDMNEPAEGASAPVDVGEGSTSQAMESQTTEDQTSNVATSKKSKGKGKSKKRKTVAASGDDNTPAGESSTILQPSAPDATTTESAEVEIVPQEATTAAAPQPSPEVAIEGSSSAVRSTALSSGPASTPVEGKSKENKKKKKGQNTQAADTTSASGKSSNVKASESTPKSMTSPQHTQKAASASTQPVKKPIETSAQETTTLGVTVSLEALGITLPVDAENGAWETVKPRAAQKGKVNVSTANVGRGGLKTTDSRVQVNQPRTQQTSRVVSSLTKTDPPVKTTSAPKTVAPPKDVRIFDPNEYPAMPTPPSHKGKAQGKDTQDSKPVSAPELTTSAKVAPVIPAVPKVTSGTITPTPEVDSDPEDLYGASPPRKTRTIVASDTVSIEVAKSTKDTEDSSAEAQGANKPVVPESSVQVTEDEKTPVTVVKGGSNAEKPTTTSTEDKNVSASNDVARDSDKQADTKSAASAGNEKTAPGPKAKGKASSTVTMSNVATGSNVPKGKTAVRSASKSDVIPAVTASSNQPKAKSKTGGTNVKSSDILSSASAPAVDPSKLSADTSSAVSDTSYKKTIHKLRRPKTKGSGSGRGQEKSEVSTADFKKPVVSDNAVASSTNAPKQSSIQQSSPVEQTPVENVSPAAEVKPATENTSTVPGLPVEQPAEKPKETPVPWDLAWADLVSPTKPGSLRKRRCSVDLGRDDANQSPLRRSSISTGHASEQRVLQFGQLPILTMSSSTDSDDPFVTADTGKGPDSQQKDPDASFTSSGTDENSRASPQADVTPRTELMLTPASPDSYNGEPYVNKEGNVVTLFRRDAEISNFPGQKHHQRTTSEPAYGNQSAVPVSNLIPRRSGYSSGRSGHTSFNTGQGSHSHPPPAVYAPSQTTGYVVHQGGQQESSTSSLGSDLKGKGEEVGTQGGIATQGLSPIPEASIGSEVDSEEEGDHNPPTTCTFCQQVKVPTAAHPFIFCPLCGVYPGSPFYCSTVCLLANAWEHSQVCRHVPPYIANTNTDFGPTYQMETFPMNNLYYLPDSAEKYRQKMFAMFYKFGAVPDIRAAHLQKWPSVDWTRILPSTQHASVGDYHIFKSQSTHTGPNLSRSHVICTIKFPLREGIGYKLMITRALNVALVTNDSNVVHFLYRILRSVLMDSRHFNSFGALEPQGVVMMEFKSQFYKEFGVLYNDGEPQMDLRFAWKQVDPTILGIEGQLGVLQYWLNKVLTDG